MGKYYDTAYRLRLNRYGLDFQSRIQRQRERDFDNYLHKTVYLVNFEWDDEFVPASLEPYKQDLTQTLGYLLTRNDIVLPNGTVLMIESQNGDCSPWMIWWLEHVEASGYNRYIVLKTTQELELNGEKVWSYFKGPGNTTISDTLRTATAVPVYNENNNLYMFILPYNPLVTKDLYFEIQLKENQLGFVVAGIDALSTSGVMYVSVDPVPLRDSATGLGDDTASSFWLSGGRTT